MSHCLEPERISCLIPSPSPVAEADLLNHKRRPASRLILRRPVRTDRASNMLTASRDSVGTTQLRENDVGLGDNRHMASCEMKRGESTPLTRLSVPVLLCEMMVCSLFRFLPCRDLLLLHQ